MRHQSLLDDQLCVCLQLGDGGADGGIDALDLLHLHLHRAALFHIDLGLRIEDALAVAVAAAVVLLHIFDMGVLAHIEAVYAVVLGVVLAAVVDAAARDNHHITVVADIKIVVDGLLDA